MNKCKKCKWWNAVKPRGEFGNCFLNPIAAAKKENDYCSHWTAREKEEDPKCHRCGASVMESQLQTNCDDPEWHCVGGCAKPIEGCLCECCLAKVVDEAEPTPKPGEWWWVEDKSRNCDTIAHIDGYGTPHSPYATEHGAFLEKVERKA